MALGAQARDVLGLVLRQGMTHTLAGVGLGVAGAFVLARVIARLLFGVATYDPATFISIRCCSF